MTGEGKLHCSIRDNLTNRAATFSGFIVDEGENAALAEFEEVVFMGEDTPIGPKYALACSRARAHLVVLLTGYGDDNRDA